MSVIDLDEVENNVMDELKDFQQETVKRIDFLYRNGQKRILVSDEVGLGKTLIARGTIAMFAKLREEEGDDLVKVAYICSNAAIAQQNLDKLKITDNMKVEDTNTSRLSMQHLNIFKAEIDAKEQKEYIQLIPLTPQTSFKLTNSQGLKDERALIYVILKHLDELKKYDKQLSKFLQFEVNDWDDLIESYEKDVISCNNKSEGAYLSYMCSELSLRLKNHKINGKTFLDQLKIYCMDEDNSKMEPKSLILELRKIFSEISIDRLNPDLIIMDEFQRFKYLLKTEDDSDIDSEMDAIINKFFKNDDLSIGNDLRILMLSATPYKMYSTLDEIDETQIDEHYSEFFKVINFLNISKMDRDKFNDVWTNYSMKLKEINVGTDSFISAKKMAEDALYKNICRTERIAEKNAIGMIDDSDKDNPLEVCEGDILSYMKFANLLKCNDIKTKTVPMDYIKSSPYLMSFMASNYKLKRDIEEYFKGYPQEISKIDEDIFWIKRSDINDYKEINFNHARLNYLMELLFKDKSELLLWIPPSKEYYSSEGVFKKFENFSKTLIFSSWEMVPKMISTMVSYEVERKTIGELSHPKSINYFSDSRYPYPRLYFKSNDGAPARMNYFTLIYPSIFLINAYDPIDCLNRGLSLEEIENEIKKKINDELDNIPSGNSSKEDSTWYYLAPLLLDSVSSSFYTNSWMDGINSLISEGVFDQKDFKEHFYKLKHLFKTCSINSRNLGRKPDDLLDVLCDMAIASPAICIYRSYVKELALRKLTIHDLHRKGLIGDIFIKKECTVDDFIYPDHIEENLVKKGLSMHNFIERNELDRNLAFNGLSEDELFVKESMTPYIKFTSQLAKEFMNSMDSPESIAVIDLIYKNISEGAYWRNVLKYSKEGNLQAVFDEYVHLLSNGLDKNDEKRIEIIHGRFLESMSLRTTLYDVDNFENFKLRIQSEDNESKKSINDKKMKLRTHFAVSFIKGTGDEGDTNRKTSVRDAFNSPFRPFVLASTSIGQEGLDFHNYCRRIVHWNLPSNPIDLEQREGRINRFAGLAIRQNVAKRYGNLEFKNNIWIEMFKEASDKEKVGGASDLIPFWGLEESDGMIKIERILPLYPFSIDKEKYDRLINILLVYRLTLGQPRQEELIDSICIDKTEEELKDLFINLSPYYKQSCK